MPKLSAILTLTTSLILGIAGVWVAYNVDMLPVSASMNAPVYDELYRVLFIIGVILFIGMTALVIYSLIQFRRRPGETGDGIDLEGNISLEIFWTAVPAVVVLFVGLYSYDIYDRMGGMVPLAHDHMGGAHEEQIWGGISSGSIESAAATNVLPRATQCLSQDQSTLHECYLVHYIV